MRPLCLAGCTNTSFSMSVLHYSHMMLSWCKQLPNCPVCSVSLLSSLQKQQMISLIDYELEMYPPLSCWSFKIQIVFHIWPCLKIKAETPLMFNHAKYILFSEQTCVPWHSFISYGKYIREHLRSGSACISYLFQAEIFSMIIYFYIFYWMIHFHSFLKRGYFLF